MAQHTPEAKAANEETRVIETPKEDVKQPARVWGEYSPEQNLRHFLDEGERYAPGDIVKAAEEINVQGYPLKAIAQQEGDGEKIGFYQELLTPERRWNPRLNYESDSPGGWQHGLVFKSGDYRPVTPEQFEQYKKSFAPYKEADQPYYIHVDPQDPSYKRIKLEDGIDSNDSAQVEVERNELVIRKKKGGGYRVKADFKSAKSHEDGGEEYKLVKGDIVVPAKFREEVIDYLQSEDWEGIEDIRGDLPNTLPNGKELQEGIDTEEKEEKPAPVKGGMQLEQTAGISSFVKDLAKEQGVEYTPQMQDEILKSYNYDYDQLISDFGKESGVSDDKMDSFKTDIYSQYRMVKPDEEAIAELEYLQKPLTPSDPEAHGFDVYQQLQDDLKLGESLLAKRTPDQLDLYRHNRMTTPDLSMFTEDLQLTPEARQKQIMEEYEKQRATDLTNRLDEISTAIATQAELNRKQYGFVHREHEAVMQEFERYDSLLNESLKTLEENAISDLNKNTPIKAGVYYFPNKKYQLEDLEHFQ